VVWRGGRKKNSFPLSQRIRTDLLAEKGKRDRPGALKNPKKGSAGRKKKKSGRGFSIGRAVVQPQINKKQAKKKKKESRKWGGRGHVPFMGKGHSTGRQKKKGRGSPAKQKQGETRREGGGKKKVLAKEKGKTARFIRMSPGGERFEGESRPMGRKVRKPKRGQLISREARLEAGKRRVYVLLWEEGDPLEKGTWHLARLKVDPRKKVVEGGGENPTGGGEETFPKKEGGRQRSTAQGDFSCGWGKESQDLLKVWIQQRKREKKVSGKKQGVISAVLPKKKGGPEKGPRASQKKKRKKCPGGKRMKRRERFLLSVLWKKGVTPWGKERKGGLWGGRKKRAHRRISPVQVVDPKGEKAGRKRKGRKKKKKTSSLKRLHRLHPPGKSKLPTPAAPLRKREKKAPKRKRKGKKAIRKRREAGTSILEGESPAQFKNLRKTRNQRENASCLRKKSTAL